MPRYSDAEGSEVLRMRFGIEMSTTIPRGVGKQFDVTRERIRQIEAKALRNCGILHVPAAKSFLDQEG